MKNWKSGMSVLLFAVLVGLPPVLDPGPQPAGQKAKPPANAQQKQAQPPK